MARFGKKRTDKQLDKEFVEDSPSSATMDATQGKQILYSEPVHLQTLYKKIRDNRWTKRDTPENITSKDVDDDIFDFGF